MFCIVVMLSMVWYMKSGHKFEKILISILEIGVACSAEFPSERSDITDAIMCRIRNNL